MKDRFPYQSKVNHRNVSALFMVLAVLMVGLYAIRLLEGYQPQASQPATAATEQVQEPVEEPADLFEASLVASEKWDVPYGLILGIANAESSMGQNWVGCEFSYNAWGIKAQPAETCNRHLKRYESWAESADDVARILRSFYLDEGRDTPEEIVTKYVGRYSQSWVNHVNAYYES